MQLISRTEALNRRADVQLVLAEVLRAGAREDEAVEAAGNAARLFARKGNIEGEKVARSLAERGGEPVEGSPPAR